MNTPEAIDNILKAFTKFVFRDSVYIFGGGAVIFSILYIYNKLPEENLTPIETIGMIGVSYAIGYAIQDLFTILGLVRTKAAVSPCRFAKYLYRRFERRKPDYPKIEADIYENAKRWLYSDAPERFRADHERTESLKQIGTVLGPCFSISGLLPLLKILISSFIPIKATITPFEATISIGAILLGIILWCLGWLKVTQQAQYLLKKFELATHGNRKVVQKS